MIFPIRNNKDTSTFEAIFWPLMVKIFDQSMTKAIQSIGHYFSGQNFDQPTGWSKFQPIRWSKTLQSHWPCSAGRWSNFWPIIVLLFLSSKFWPTLVCVRSLTKHLVEIGFFWCGGHWLKIWPILVKMAIKHWSFLNQHAKPMTNELVKISTKIWSKV